jgi:hypothetical protein
MLYINVTCLFSVSYHRPDWGHPKILRNSLTALANMCSNHSCYVLMLPYSFCMWFKSSFPVFSFYLHEQTLISESECCYFFELLSTVHYDIEQESKIFNIKNYHFFFNYKTWLHILRGGEIFKVLENKVLKLVFAVTWIKCFKQREHYVKGTWFT